MADSKYEQVWDGEWLQIDRPVLHLGCCDCGLVHDVRYRVHKGKVQLMFNRNNRRTGQLRRQNKVRAQRKPNKNK